jgi:deazaflavin-dependent oxidoreductase (nitroreductase family)
MSGNRFVVAFYRLGLLPLLGAGRSILLIITNGRVSAKPRFSPVGHHRIGGDLHIFSAWGKQSNWYKNLLASPDDVSVQVGFRRIPLRVEVLDDPAGATRVLRRFIAESPARARQLIGWDLNLDRVVTADFSRMLQSVMIARFLKR